MRFLHAETVGGPGSGFQVGPGAPMLPPGRSPSSDCSKLDQLARWFTAEAVTIGGLRVTPAPSHRHQRQQPLAQDAVLEMKSAFVEFWHLASLAGGSPARPAAFVVAAMHAGAARWTPARAFRDLPFDLFCTRPSLKSASWAANINRADIIIGFGDSLHRTSAGGPARVRAARGALIKRMATARAAGGQISLRESAGCQKVPGVKGRRTWLRRVR